ncbi:MAG: hypothetical protein QXX17_03340 [Conexivisphaerales archaeon]
MTVYIVLIALLGMGLTPAFATTYYGPSFTVPTAISPGSTINIVISTGSNSSFVAPPAGSDPPCNKGVCVYPLQACTNSSDFYYIIHQVTVTDPKGNEYMLGSNVTSGLGVAGGTGVPPHAPLLNVTIGDSFTLPFGQGVGGFSYTTVLSTSLNPSQQNPEGPYYWWTVAGNQYGSNLRLDQNPSINPTLIQGTYTIDLEGWVVCGPSLTQTTYVLFFDAGIIVTTPQFASGMAFAVAVGLLLVLATRRFTSKINRPY